MPEPGPTEVELPPSSHHDAQSPGFPGVGARVDFDDEQSSATGTTGTDDRSPEKEKQDAELADRLSSLIEDANRRVVPLCKTIRKVSAP